MPNRTQLCELAGIFARGIARLHHRDLLAIAPGCNFPKTALETAGQGLEQSATTRLSVTRGLRTETTDKRRL